MSDFNPYQSPEYGGADAELKPVVPEGGVWRRGNLLVMHKQAVLPDRCVKTNAPAQGSRLKRTLRWHAMWVYLTILMHPLIYIIVALMLQKRAVIYIGLSQPRLNRLRRTTVIAWVLAAGSIGMMVLGAVLADMDDFRRNSPAPVLVFLGTAFLVICAIYGLIGTRTVSAKWITKDYIWLKGVHPDYLAELPEWPESS
jgi:hypothetical protein